MDTKVENISQNPSPAGMAEILNPVYAQFVALSSNLYDTTLIFSQIQPVIKPGEKNVVMVVKEVARIVIPPQTANELKELFMNLKVSAGDEKKAK